MHRTFDRTLRTMGILGLVILALGTFPGVVTAQAYQGSAGGSIEPTVTAEGAAIVAKEDLFCLGYSSGGGGEIPCDVRVYQCSKTHICAYVCGLGGEDSKPCTILPWASTTGTSTLAAQHAEDLFCVGWGTGGDVNCLVQVYECSLVACIRTCVEEIDHGRCRLPF